MDPLEASILIGDGDTANHKNRLGEMLSNVRCFIGGLAVRTICYLRPTTDMPFSDPNTLNEEAQRHTSETIL